jgi:Holliday junction resolvasome RuvABC DNA-binding subunit
VGARAAEKIIATLRGKVIAEAAMQDGAIVKPVDPRDIGLGRLEQDTVEAIVALGFGRADARRWVAETLGSHPELTSLEALTLAVLRERGRPG